jgi:hypothetical protein
MAEQLAEATVFVVMVECATVPAEESDTAAATTATDGAIASTVSVSTASAIALVVDVGDSAEVVPGDGACGSAPTRRRDVLKPWSSAVIVDGAGRTVSVPETYVIV